MSEKTPFRDWIGRQLTRPFFVSYDGSSYTPSSIGCTLAIVGGLVIVGLIWNAVA